jgi:bisphosphoglycerate-dependent phosphoglycerate mutase
MAERVLAAHVLMRHGERERLVKDLHTFQEQVNPSLTERGREEATAAGERLNKMFPPSWGRVYLESTDLDRTLQTAIMVAATLRPDGPTPVHTVALQNDIDLRAYDKCTSFNENVADWYGSEQFATFESEADFLLRDIEGRLQGRGQCEKEAADAASAIEEMFNLYDCLVTVTDSPSELLGSTSVFEELESRAEFLELAKHNEKLAGRMLGGMFLSQLVHNFEDAATESDGVTGLLTVSVAHYPTMLGVLASLKKSGSMQQVPPTASYLLFELITAELSPSVRLTFVNGESNKQVIDLSSSGPIALGDFRKLDGVYTTAQDWCSECGNVDADACLRVGMQPLLSHGESQNFDLLAFGLVAIGCLAVGVCLREVVFRFQNRAPKSHAGLSNKSKDCAMQGFAPVIV